MRYILQTIHIMYLNAIAYSKSDKAIPKQYIQSKYSRNNTVLKLVLPLPLSCSLYEFVFYVWISGNNVIHLLHQKTRKFLFRFSQFDSLKYTAAFFHRTKFSSCKKGRIWRRFNSGFTHCQFFRKAVRYSQQKPGFFVKKLTLCFTKLRFDGEQTRKLSCRTSPNYFQKSTSF